MNLPDLEAPQTNRVYLECACNEAHACHLRIHGNKFLGSSRFDETGLTREGIFHGFSTARVLLEIYSRPYVLQNLKKSHLE